MDIPVDTSLPPGPNLDSGLSNQQQGYGQEDFVSRFSTPPTIDQEETGRNAYPQGSGFNPMSSQNYPQQNLQQPSTLQKDIELVSLKLDNVSSILKNMENRLARIEKIAEDSHKEEPKKKGWEY
jgi:hypothetical protein